MNMMPVPGIPFPGMYTRPSHEERRPLAMVFITPQPHIANTYDPSAALHAGTLFPELNKPFIGKRGAV